MDVSGSEFHFAPPPVPPRARPPEPTNLLFIEWSDLERHEQLGQPGSYGTAYRGTWKSRHQEVAIKVLRGVSGDDTDFMNEVTSMAALTGTPHIAHFYGACKQPPSIIMEYLPKGSLHKLLRERGSTLDWSTKTRVAYQIVKGINFLHNWTRPIFHRDIKSLNLLLDTHLNIKVADFGMAKMRLNSSQDSAVSEPRGTVRWNAPELYEGKRYTEKSDVFSIGTVLWELVATDNVPYPDLRNGDLRALLASGTLPPLPIPPDTPASFQRWITHCRSVNPADRPTCFELMTDIRSTMDEEGISNQVSQDPATLTKVLQLKRCTVVEPILSLMRANSHNARIQRYGCERIQHLLQQERWSAVRNQLQQFHVLGGCDVLISAMSVHDDAETQYYAVKILAVYCSAHFDRVLACNGVDKVLVCMKAYLQHAEIVKAACGVLHNLAVIGKAVMGKPVIDILVACLQRCPREIDVVKLACITLKNICSGDSAATEYLSGELKKSDLPPQLINFVEAKRDLFNLVLDLFEMGCSQWTWS